jgi:hypothetical protein
LAGPCEYIGFSSKVKLRDLPEMQKSLVYPPLPSLASFIFKAASIKSATLFALNAGLSGTTAKEAARPIRIISSESTPV